MSRSGCKHFILLSAALISVPSVAAADEGGVSFWLPGLFGSLAAAPQQPGGPSPPFITTPRFPQAAMWALRGERAWQHSRQREVWRPA